MDSWTEGVETAVPVAPEHLESGHGGQFSVSDLDEGSGKADKRCWHHQSWLTVSIGTPLWSLADEVFKAIPPPVVSPGRTPRRDAAERRMLAVFSLLANLSVLALSPLRYETLLVTVHRGKGDRYTHAAFNSSATQTALLAMEFLGLVSVTRGQAQRTRTEITATPLLLAKLQTMGVTLADIKHHVPFGETILLKRRGGRGDASELVDYADTETSSTKRTQMQELNASLSNANVRYGGVPVEPFHMVRIFLDDPKAEPWTRHGRLYRGFHLNVKKEDRYKLTISGEELCDLDWSACFIHIAYGIAGAAFPTGDPYGIPGLEHCRDTVKAIMSALLSRRAGTSGDTLPDFKLPRGTAVGLPEGWNGKRFLQAAQSYHAPIAHLFKTPEVWAETSFIESEMMLEVLEKLRASGCIALPCHDGLLCPQRFKGLAVVTMETVSKVRLGQAIPVTEKAILRPD